MSMRKHKHHVEDARIGGFTAGVTLRAVTGGVLGAAANLELLRRVDQTCDSLGIITRSVQPLCGPLHELARGLSEMEVIPGEYTDPDDLVINDLSVAIRGFEDYLPSLVRRRRAAERDAQLGEAQRDMLITSFDDAINVISDVIELGKELRSAIIRRDLAAEPRDGQAFDTLAALLTDLR